MKTIILFISGLFMFSSLMRAQAYNGYADNLFLRQQPNARAEAMGRGNAALTGDAFGMFYNPAVTSFSNGAEASYSYLDPNGLYSSEIGYTQIGLVYNSQKFGAIGFSYLNYSYGTFYATPIDNPEIIEKFDVYENIYLINYSVEIMENFSAGINFSYYYNSFSLEENPDAFVLDAGILKKFILEPEKQSIFAALSCGNILNSPVTIKTSQEEAKVYLPSILHAAASYEYLYNPHKTDFIPFGFTLCAEYQDVLNHKYYTKTQAGAELKFLEILKVRAGFYNYEEPDLGIYDKTYDHSEMTYGFGLSLPFYKFMKNIPLELSADYAKLPNYVYDPNYINLYDDYTILTVNLAVKL